MQREDKKTKTNKYKFLHFFAFLAEKLLGRNASKLLIAMFALNDNRMKPFLNLYLGLIVSRVEGVAILPTLAALPHSPLL